jgi:hypothetical protein
MVDSQGRKWEVMERPDGSVVCYYTRESESAHWVVWDSLDVRLTRRAVDSPKACGEYTPAFNIPGSPCLNCDADAASH